MYKKIEILGVEILPKSSHFIYMDVARLHNNNTLKVPVIIERGSEDGPTVLLNAGVHGDELNGVEIVRQMINRKLNKPNKGTIICIPTLNIFGFINQDRKFPDGKDLNRMFPGTASGSLASQFAYSFTEKIIPNVDYVLDFHTGGAERVNVPQIRCVFKDEDNLELAKVFGTRFIMNSPNVSKSLRAMLGKMKIPILLYEGGKTMCYEDYVIEEGVNGAIRVLNHLGLTNNEVCKSRESIIITKSSWLRASFSGMFHLKIDVSESGNKVSKGTILATITDPYGQLSKNIKAPSDCHIFCVNTAPIVNKGDAIFHITKINNG